MTEQQYRLLDRAEFLAAQISREPEVYPQSARRLAQIVERLSASLANESDERAHTPEHALA